MHLFSVELNLLDLYLPCSNMWVYGLQSQSCIRVGERQNLLLNFCYPGLMDRTGQTNITSVISFSVIMTKEFLKELLWAILFLHWGLKIFRLHALVLLLQDANGRIWKLDLTFSNVVSVFSVFYFFISFIVTCFNYVRCIYNKICV